MDDNIDDEAAVAKYMLPRIMRDKSSDVNKTFLSRPRPRPRL